MPSQVTACCLGPEFKSLDKKELDVITDSIYKTLENPRGRELLRKYLGKKGKEKEIECLNVYEECLRIKQSESDNVIAIAEEMQKLVNGAAYELKGIIDYSLMARLKEIKSAEDLTTVLEETMHRCAVHFVDSEVFEDFKKYVVKGMDTPCTRAS